jgi:photosystem II stability/assembly factor-like uncharacterized protein
VGPLIALLLAAATAATPAPTPGSAVWAPQKSGSTAELRGLAVQDPARAWATGADGTVLRTRDGSKWDKVAVPGGEGLDFRDVAVLPGGAVVLMAAGQGDKSRIFRSTDDGKSWTLVHTNPDKDGFYDAIAFFDDKDGMVLGDPVERYFRVRLTNDGGKTWTLPPPGSISEAFPGEGAFAAGGTCLIALAGTQQGWFVTGGARVARVFRTFDRGRSWSAAASPVPAGNASSGLFSVAFLDPKIGFVVGGNYKDPALAALNGARSKDGGRTWVPVPVSASGFYSAITAVPGLPNRLVAVGPMGTAVSEDQGRTWRHVDTTPLNAVAFFDAQTGWAAGPKGTIVRFRAIP